MKHFQLNKQLILFVLTGLLSLIFTACEVEDINGKYYYIDESVHKYLPDTAQKSHRFC